MEIKLNEINEERKYWIRIRNCRRRQCYIVTESSYRDCTFAAMADADPDIRDCLVRRTGMYMMGVGFPSAGRFRRTLAGVDSLDNANTLQRRHSLELGGPRAAVGIR